MRRVLSVGFALIALAAPAPDAVAGPGPAWARFGADTIVEARSVSGTSAADALTVDTMASVRVARDVMVIARPLLSREAGEWELSLAQLAVRYERAGDVGVRLEGGFLSSPVGLGTFATRATANPTVVPPISYASRLPALEAGGPELYLYAPTYPLGAQASVSSGWWDGRVAVLDSSPMRLRMALGEPSPARAAQLVAGGGVTPRPGVRFGGWIASGNYARVTGADGRTRDRAARMAGLEAEYVLAYTKLAGEWVENRIETGIGHARVTGWSAEITQTISPRWFVAGRVQSFEVPPSVGEDDHHYDDYDHDYDDNHDDHDSAYGTYTAAAQALAASRPSSALEGQGRLRQVTFETTVGYRLTPGVTLRAGGFGVRYFGSDITHRRVAVSIVWSTRWE